MRQNSILTGCVLMATGIAFGAFGAHALRGAVSQSDLDIWEKAVFYQIVHGLAFLIISTFKISSSTALALGLGTLIFSGSLYLLVLTGVRELGAITPIGGTLLILGWVMLAIQSRKV